MGSPEQVADAAPVIPTVTAITHDLHWMAQQIGKTAEWVRHNLDSIPHHRIGKTPRFTDANLADYLRTTAVQPKIMQTAGRRRRSA